MAFGIKKQRRAAGKVLDKKMVDMWETACFENLEYNERWADLFTKQCLFELIKISIFSFLVCLSNRKSEKSLNFVGKFLVLITNLNYRQIIISFEIVHVMLLYHEQYH